MRGSVFRIIFLIFVRKFESGKTFPGLACLLRNLFGVSAGAVCTYSRIFSWNRNVHLLNIFFGHVNSEKCSLRQKFIFSQLFSADATLKNKILERKIAHENMKNHLQK